MGKLLLMVAGLFLVVAVLRIAASSRRQPKKPPAPPTNSAESLQTLLPCPQCGVHMAASELAEHAASHHR